MSDQPQPTPEEVNRAIAESLGWTDFSPVYDATQSFVLIPHAGRNLDGFKQPVPNFWGSLDACAEMEKALDTPELRDAYANELFNIVPHDENHGPAFDGGEDIMLPSNFSYVTAIPHRRCTAYLRVKGLWRWG